MAQSKVIWYNDFNGHFVRWRTHSARTNFYFYIQRIWPSGFTYHIPLTPIGVLAPVSAYAGPSAQPPIDVSPRKNLKSYVTRFLEYI